MWKSAALDDTYELYQTVNGTDTTVDISGGGTLTLDPLQQAVIWILIIGGVAVASGIAVVGSGLNETASTWLTYMIFFTSIWAMFSTLPFPMIIAIETFGITIYLILTIIYAIACIMWIGGAR